jgi:hypothetical protein
VINLRNFFDDYDFHDSVVDGIVLNTQTKQMSFSIDLCLFRQKGYQKGDPQNQKGKLVFSHVKEFMSDPDISLIHWKNQDGQILDADTDDQGIISIFFTVCDYSSKQEDVYIIKFSAEKAEWLTLED